ncbi:MAG: DUF2000 family protein [Nocardioides sp.]
MRYEDTGKRLVVALRQGLEWPVAFNAAGHTIHGLTAAGQPADWEILDYVFADERRAAISKHPVITLTGRRNQLVGLLDRATEDPNLRVNFFCESALADSAEKQLAQCKAALPDAANLLAVGLYGDSEQVRTLTAKFSALRS